MSGRIRTSIVMECPLRRRSGHPPKVSFGPIRDICACRKHLLKPGTPLLLETQLSADAASQTIGQRVAKPLGQIDTAPRAVYDLAAHARSE
jgi:hypothetical protein